MPSLSNSGIATSARHVVGLQEPPRNTSTFGSSLELAVEVIGV